jgi:hypothetical protein
MHLCGRRISTAYAKIQLRGARSGGKAQPHPRCAADAVGFGRSPTVANEVPAAARLRRGQVRIEDVEHDLG